MYKTREAVMGNTKTNLENKKTNLSNKGTEMDNKETNLNSKGTNLENMEPKTDKEQVKINRKSSKKELQLYIVIFFTIILALIIFAGLIQQRNTNESMMYKEKLEETKTSLLTNTSALKDLQNNYLKLEEEFKKLQSENEALKAEKQQLETQLVEIKESMEMAEILLSARNEYAEGRHKAAREFLNTVDKTKLQGKLLDLYEELNRKIKK